MEIEACAAVTALTHTLKYSIETLTSDRPELELKKGFFVIKHENLERDAELLISSFLTGIKVLSEAYPQQIELIFDQA